MQKDLLKLNNIQIRATHGCYESEKIHPQNFVVHVICQIDGALDDSDLLHHTINYENLRAIVFKVFEQPPLNLIETLANQIAAQVLMLDKVFSVEVRINKPEIWKDALPEVHIYRSH